jgi:hypothetical protein
MAPIDWTVETPKPAAKDIAAVALMVLVSYALTAWAVVSRWPRSLILAPLVAVVFYAFLMITAADEPV